MIKHNKKEQNCRDEYRIELSSRVACASTLDTSSR
jgi:hypothetical protein